MDTDYIAQRLKAISGEDGDASKRINELETENALLKQKLEQLPAASFKSDAQTAFEQSPEFENILNAFFIRFMREKFGAEFRDSAHVQSFQAVANKAFSEFEKKYKQKEIPKNEAQTIRKSGKAIGNGKPDTGQHDG